MSCSNNIQSECYIELIKDNLGAFCFKYIINIKYNKKFDKNSIKNHFITLMHDFHPNDSTNKNNWSELKLIGTEYRENCFCFVLPYNLYCDVGIFRQFKLIYECENMKQYLDFQYSHNTNYNSSLQWACGTMNNNFGGKNNCVFFHTNKAYIHLMERYFNQIIEFKMEDFLEWMHKYNLLDEYYSLKNQDIFDEPTLHRSVFDDTIFEIKISIYTNPGTGSYWVPKDLRILHNYSGKLAISFMTETSYCDECNYVPHHCQCYHRHGALCQTHYKTFTFNSLGLNMLQYKFVNKNGYYFCNNKNLKINNGLGGSNNYFYYHKSKLCRDNIGAYVVFLNNNKRPFVQSEFEMYLSDNKHEADRECYTKDWKLKIIETINAVNYDHKNRLRNIFEKYKDDYKEYEKNYNYEYEGYEDEDEIF